MAQGRLSRISLFATATLAIMACGPEEPCNLPAEYLDVSTLPPNETPFDDGRSAFEACQTCDVSERHGPATSCQVYFGEDAAPDALCMYDPMGTTLIAGTGIHEDLPNEFDYCVQRCRGVPNDEHLSACAVRANADGISEVACILGSYCPE
jgi:hypothetical protein